MKKNTLLSIKISIILILFFQSFISCHKDTSSNEPIEWVTDEEIPILAWHSVRLDAASLRGFEEVKNAGYTHSLSTIWDNEDPKTSFSANLLARALDYADKAGLKVIAGCHELTTDTENTVKRFMNHPAVVGWFLYDEPSLTQFVDLGMLANKIKAIDDKNFVYVNLRPSDATVTAMGTTTYSTYLNEFIKIVPVDFISFDKYPCMVDEEGNNYVLDYWYDNLQIIADASKKVNKDFWAFASGVKFEPQQAEPSIETFRLQMYTNLAYGAQGLQYFVFQTSQSPIYPIVKMMNREIQNYAKVFLDSKVISVTHTGKEIPYNTKRFQKAPNVIKTFETGDAGAVVSHLEKDNREFFVVVSRDINNNLPVTISVDKSVRKVTKHGTIEEVKGTVTENVLPGDILVYTWDK